MRDILTATKRFEQVLFIDEDTNTASVKSKVFDFFQSYLGKDIGELVFYFSGHGEVAAEEFYYLLSDYQSKRRRQTSLENSELDNVVRALSPKLFVKIVDACHSGVTYVKDSEDFGKYLAKAATPTLQNVYFLYSSQSDRKSYQDNHLSYFTESIVKSK